MKVYLYFKESSLTLYNVDGVDKVQGNQNVTEGKTRQYQVTTG